MAEVERASVLDRLLLVLGGERWLVRALAVALSRLDVLVAPTALERAA